MQVELKAAQLAQAETSKVAEQMVQLESHRNDLDRKEREASARIRELAEDLKTSQMELANLRQHQRRQLDEAKAEQEEATRSLLSREVQEAVQEERKALSETKAMLEMQAKVRPFITWSLPAVPHHATPPLTGSGKPCAGIGAKVLVKDRGDHQRTHVEAAAARAALLAK